MKSAPYIQVFAVPAARWSFLVAVAVLLVALLAGAVRVLPLLMAPGVPPEVALPLARGVIGVALETALFVAPPIGWALAATRLVDRGEARALAAVGVGPLRIVRSAWSAALVVAVGAALAAASWGREAAAPGRLVRALCEDARAACVAAATRPGPRAEPAEVVDVPLVGISWVCFPGAPARAVGRPPFGGGSSAFSALAVDFADDLRALALDDLQLVIPDKTGAARGSLRVGRATVRGLAPLGRASNLGPAERTALLAISAVALAALAATLVLAYGISGRPWGAAIGVGGAGASLAVLSVLERAPAAKPMYFAVGAAGLGAVFLVARLARLASQRSRSGSSDILAAFRAKKGPPWFARTRRG